MFRKEISFDGCKVTVTYDRKRIDKLLEFLFLDLPDQEDLTSSETFDIRRDTKKKQWVLKRKKRQLYKGDNLGGLGTILMGDVLFHLICENDRGLAIHAGLVSDDKNTILIPGISGSGKSSVTTWLVCNGMRYHTDELVTIDLDTHRLKAFTRPLNIKTRGVKAVSSIVDLDAIEDQLEVSPAVTMIPHRLVNQDFCTTIPPLTHIIFPKYVADRNSKLTELSKAEAGLELMKCNVIARNLPSHGFNQVIKLVRDIPAYRVHYQHFDELPALMEKIL